MNTTADQRWRIYQMAQMRATASYARASEYPNDYKLQKIAAANRKLTEIHFQRWKRAAFPAKQKAA
ncbi:MAG: hypothetical protein ACR2PR_08985 [Pseudohongiellaceae bacterium]